MAKLVIRRSGPVTLGLAALSLVACHRAPPAGLGERPAVPETPLVAFNVDELFKAATFRLDGKKVMTTYGYEDEGTSESEDRWLIDCRQSPLDAPPSRRVADLHCDAVPAPDDPDDVRGGPFEISLDGYWVATAAGLWWAVDLDEPLEPIAMLLSLPPVARYDEVPEPVSEDEALDQDAREVYETKQTGEGVWCHQHLSDPGGGAEASYQSWCFDARGLLSGTAGDGHGANTWESSFTRPAS